MPLSLGAQGDLRVGLSAQLGAGWDDDGPSEALMTLPPGPGLAAGGGDCRSAASNQHNTVPEGLAAMGTLLVIGASFISCLGTNMQKLSHNMNETLPREQRVPMHKSWRWWIGIVCMIAGSLMDMAALPFVPMSRVAALGASGMVANVIITPLFLKERLTRHDLAGSTIIILGTTLSCTFGAGREPTITSGCLMQYFAATVFLVYAAFFVVICAVLLFLIEGFRRKQRAAVAAGVIVQTLETIWAHENRHLIRTVPSDPRFPYFDRFGAQFYPVVHAVYSGAVGACSVMFAKICMVCFGNALSGQSAAGIAIFFAFLIPTGFCVWNQIRFLNFALKIYRDALFVLPVYQAVWIAAGILAGLIFYQEYLEITDSHIAWFCLGTLVSFVGIIVLARRKSKTPPRAGVPSGRPSPSCATGSPGGRASPGSVGQQMQQALREHATVELSDDWARRLEVSFMRPLAPAIEDYFHGGGGGAWGTFAYDYADGGSLDRGGGGEAPSLRWRRDGGGDVGQFFSPAGGGNAGSTAAPTPGSDAARRAGGLSATASAKDPCDKASSPGGRATPLLSHQPPSPSGVASAGGCIQMDPTVTRQSSTQSARSEEQEGAPLLGVAAIADAGARHVGGIQ